MRTLPWSWYTDEAVLRREQERIFARSWQYAGHVEELAEPGSFSAVRMGHVPVLIVRDEDGELRAFLNVCRHRGSELMEGAGKRKTLQCRYHAWTYGLDGRLRNAPRADREGGFDSEISLVRLPLARLGPLLFVNPDAQAPAFEEVIGELPRLLDLDGLAFFRRLDYAVEANWKVVIENYLECYHCPTAHPGLSKTIDVDPARYVLEASEWYSSQYADSKDGGGDVDRGQFHFLWPNLRINVFPGVRNLSVGVAWPDGPGRTRGFFDYFFPEDVGEAEIEDLIAFDDEVGREDRALVESVQRGVAAGLLDEGVLLDESEQLIAHFDALVERALAYE